LQLQSFVENETYNFVLTDALQEKEKQSLEKQSLASQNNKYTNVTTYISRH
jgi:hypothetical protein